MYKNIIFDLGGVMVDFDPKTYLVDRFCNAEVEEQVSQLTFESEEWKLLDAGLITRSEANLRMLARAKEYGRAFEVQGVLDDWMHILRPRRRMQELVREAQEPWLLRLLPEQYPRGCAGFSDRARPQGPVRRRRGLLRGAHQQARPAHL